MIIGGLWEKFILYCLLARGISAYSGLFGRPRPTSRLHLSGTDDSSLPTKVAFDTAVLNRYACKKFKRFDGKQDNPSTGSPSNQTIVQQALHCLEIARQAPSAFNTQPYKFVVVQSPEQKELLSQHCLGPNKQRVLDSDCTVIFLADREIFRTFPRFRSFLLSNSKPDREPSRFQLLKMQFYIILFSSGYPIPRILAAPISFCVRTVVSFLNIFSTRLLRYSLPSLANAETWASKQVMMVAMAYMLGCCSRGLATIPMEGINAGGIRNVLKVPRRYAIPLIVSTGLAFDDSKATRLHKTITSRYPMKEVIFQDSFGAQMRLAPQS